MRPDTGGVYSNGRRRGCGRDGRQRRMHDEEATARNMARSIDFAAGRGAGSRSPIGSAEIHSRTEKGV